MSASIGVNLRVTGHCSQGGRKYMEDFFSVAYQQSDDEKDLEYAFFGIYDGHGGCEAATYAKEHLMNEIVNQKLFWSENDADILKAIREGFNATHNKMWREQAKWPKTPTGLPSTAGTTASVAFIRHGKIYIGHVGDSGIVLGYQDENNPQWKARQLTQEHKPESVLEKTRIMNSGGKVVTKSGVPRVVWTRPRLGHKGPVRRSTPIDEIPFLAVARSLGDLWSYNSELNEFVVSPDPDVRVIPIDPKKFRCLIFGTDGLWNVLSASGAVEIVHGAEVLNERNMFSNAPKSWLNPSKYLVDKALERWSNTKMRADNTSVVTIMLDPPGPPKRDLIRAACPTGAHILDHVLYIQNEGERGAHCKIDSDNDSLPSNVVPLRPSDPYAPSTSYNLQHHSVQHTPETATSSSSSASYMSSGFVESYNLLDDQQIPYQQPQHHEAYSTEPMQHHQQSTLEYVPVEEEEETYSLTKLETRSEQLTAMAAGISGSGRETHLMEIDTSFQNYTELGPSTSQDTSHVRTNHHPSYRDPEDEIYEIETYEYMKRYFKQPFGEERDLERVPVTCIMEESPLQIHEISSSNQTAGDATMSPKPCSSASSSSGQKIDNGNQEHKVKIQSEECDIRDESETAGAVKKSSTVRRPQKPNTRQSSSSGIVTRSQDARTPAAAKVKQKENTKARSETRALRCTLRSGKILNSGFGSRLRNVHGRGTNRLRILAVH